MSRQEELKKFIEKCKDKIKFRALSHNPYLTFQVVLAFPDEDWDWIYLSRFLAVRVEDVVQHLYLPWDFNQLSLNERMSVSECLRHKHLPWNWKYLSSCLGILITTRMLTENPELDWNWDHISEYSPIFGQNFLKNLHLPWNWNKLSVNKHLTFQFLHRNEHLPWNWEMLSQNRILSKHAEKYPELPWTSSVSLRPTLQQQLENPELVTDWAAFSKTVTLKHVSQYPDLPWNWDIVCANVL